MKLSLARAALAVCLLSFLSAANAAEPPPLTLDAALQRAAATHPELAGFLFERRAAQAAVEAARQRPLTELGLSVEDALGSGARSGFDSAQTTLSLSQLVELGDRSARRGEVAQAGQNLLRTDQAARQLDVVAGVARRFVQVQGQQLRRDRIEDAQRLAAQLARTVEERVSAAAAPEAERARARVAIAEADLLAEDAGHVLQTYRAQLAAAMGLAGPDFGALQAEFFALPTSLTFAELQSRLEHSPDFLYFADQTRLADARLNLARSQARGELRASLGLRRHETTGDNSFVAGFSLPLFAGRQAAPRIAQAQAEAQRIALDRQPHWNAARAQLYAHYQEMQHARHVETVLREEILPALNAALSQTEDAYRRGRYSWLQLSEIQQKLLSARLRRIEATEEFHINRIEIERLTGESLSSAGDSQ